MIFFSIVLSVWCNGPDAEDYTPSFLTGQKILTTASFLNRTMINGSLSAKAVKHYRAYLIVIRDRFQNGRDGPQLRLEIALQKLRTSF